jgi:hypothetical protein
LLDPVKHPLEEFSENSGEKFVFGGVIMQDGALGQARLCRHALYANVVASMLCEQTKGGLDDLSLPYCFDADLRTHTLLTFGERSLKKRAILNRPDGLYKDDLPIVKEKMGVAQSVTLFSIYPEKNELERQL